MGLGFYMGDWLNKPLDNLRFTALFKRPKWFLRNQGNNDEEIYRAIAIFDKAMTTGFGSIADQPEIKYARNAGEEISAYPNDMGTNHLHVENILKSGFPESSKYIGWGWKEPNTHIFLKYLAYFYPDFRYIHVIRHGLDMAYSNNHQQLLNWGTLDGFTFENQKSATPQNLLRYWIDANQRVIKLGRTLLGEKLLVIRLEDLCLHPELSIKTMAKFVGINVDSRKLQELSQLPVMPLSSGRYRAHSLHVFPPEDLKALKDFGYEIENRRMQGRHIAGAAIKILKRLYRSIR